MKIKKIFIENYGPIEEFDIMPAAFELIFGSNEAGKTAIVEILNYVLFKRTIKELRYEKPHAMLVEIGDRGKTHKLPSKKKVLELPVGDISNLLYVQASESSIYGSRGEASFWDGMKSMLSKIGRGISYTKLDEQIFEAVGLQPKREIWKRERQEQIDRDSRRKAGLEAYLKRIGEIEEQEAELADLMEKNETLKKTLGDMENYKKYRAYEELSNLYKRYKETRTELQEYERYKREYLAEWQRLQAERKVCLEARAHLEEKKREVGDLEKDLNALRAKEKMAVERDLESYRSKPEQGGQEVPFIIAVGLLLSAVAVFVASFFTKIPLTIASSFLAVAVLVFFYSVYQRRRTKKWLMDTDMLLRKAQEVFRDMTSLAELPVRMGKLEQDIITKETLLQEKNRDVARFSREEILTEIDEKISVLRNKTGLAEISDLQGKMTKKAGIEEALTRLNADISQRLHETEDRKWERLISALKTAKPDKEPDLELERDIKTEKDRIQERVDHLSRNIQLFRNIEQAKFDVANDRSAFIEYDKLNKRLSENQLDKEAALAAREILRSMSSELDEFIEDILSGEDGLSDYFKFVTERYGQVTVKNRDFVVTDASGKSYEVEELSSGARDQLLLCFRLAALRKVYPDGAFLILDDAFIFADWQRRRRLAHLMKNFIDQGNQVVYLTSDDHTRDLFADCGAHITTLE
jgi:uncharacterized protein YhaN